ncbi:MAG: helix-turn-helix domain-containing protein [Turicibacter sp.]
MEQLKIGEVIAVTRKQKRLTQQQLADQIGVSNKAISKWENGDGYPDITNLPRIAQVLELSTDDLLGIKSNNQTSMDSTTDQWDFNRLLTVCINRLIAVYKWSIDYPIKWCVEHPGSVVFVGICAGIGFILGIMAWENSWLG